MRVVSCMIVLAILGSTGAGCSMFKKNTNGPQGPVGDGTQPPRFPALNNSDPMLPAAPTLPTAPMKVPGASSSTGKRGDEVLAGTVVDAFQKPIGNAYIRLVSLDEKDGQQPLEVAADAQGLFIIQGLKKGSQCKLIARVKFGDKMYAGTVLTSAPNPNVFIMLRENLGSDLPPIPGSPAEQLKKDATPKDDAKLVAPPARTPVGNTKTTEAQSLPTTVTIPMPPANTQPSTPAFTPGIAQGPPKENRLPMLSIGGPSKSPTVKSNESKLDTGPTRVPSCVLVGNHLENLALRDSRGQTWEYKKHGAGKLILIDFWGTHCLPCRDTMPALNRLQQQYGARGLQVIGIAIEKGADERREAEAVNKLCASMQVNYRQLMGRTLGFDAFKSFNCQGLPTLLLLSEQGDIIYQHLGRPEPADLNTLERIIQNRLGSRSF